MGFNYGFGWKPEGVPDVKNVSACKAYYAKDWKQHPKMSMYVPSSYQDLESNNSIVELPRRNQGNASTCVPHGVLRGCEIKRVQNFLSQGLSRQDALAKHVDLSRVHMYYMTRERMVPREVDRDEGAIISIAADILSTFGVCKEDLMPYSDKLYDLCITPPDAALRNGYTHKVKSWYRITSTGEDRVLDCIANLAVGNCIAYGTVVGDNWVNYNGSQPLSLVSGKVLGSHCTLLVGWQPSRFGGCFLGENSWGTWGRTDMPGFYDMAPEVIEDSESKDFVVLEGGFEDWAEAA
jgi:hypothetical protein